MRSTIETEIIQANTIVHAFKAGTVHLKRMAI